MVLYHLRKFGIARRDRAAHLRKVTTSMVNEWERLYRAGKSLKQVAGVEVDPVTVWKHLRKRNVRLRNKVEAQITAVTRHAKSPFSGGKSVEAYLLGFARGDLNVSRHGRAVRVKTATTHPLMVELIKNLFDKNGFVRVKPRLSRLTGYEWSIQVDLDQSFSFLLEDGERVPSWVFKGINFRHFLAGFFDAEGSIWLNESASYPFQLSLTNSNPSLLERICDSLRNAGYNPYLRRDASGPVWKIQMWRKSEVERLLSQIPLKHAEKTAKARIVLRFGQSPIPYKNGSMVGDWKSLIQEIRSGRDSFVESARLQLETG